MRALLLLAGLCLAAAGDPVKAFDAFVRRMESGEVNRIQFELDSAVLDPASFATLDMVADLLLEYPRLKLWVTAHTCTLGSEKHNDELSHERALSVKDYLTRRGVPPPSVRTKGYGSRRPIADNSTDEGRRRNRRVEFKVTTRGWDAVY